MTAMGLNQARVQAITRGHNIDITFAAYTFAITDADNGNELMAVGELPSAITANVGTTTFTPLGTVTAPLTITLSNGDGSRAVSVGLIGEVQVQ
jgi:hypothetical protein